MITEEKSANDNGVFFVARLPAGTVITEDMLFDLIANRPNWWEVTPKMLGK